MTKTEANKEPFMVVAIDGGAASGKSSTARLIAERFCFLHVDTGTHYRSVARACLDAGLKPEEQSALRSFLTGMQLETLLEGNKSRLGINGAPPFPDPLIRSVDVNANVSQFAALPSVRETVKEYQRQQVAFARRSGFAGLVMEGRDIGTVILPDAHLKVFLTADPETRAKRRLKEGGVDHVADRDKLDSSRQTAPLRASDDAVCIDNSMLSLEDVAEQVAGLIKGASK